MKTLEINIPLTKRKNFFDFPYDLEIHSIRITTDNLADLRSLELILKIFYNNKIIFKKFIQPNNKDYMIFEIGFKSKLLGNRLTIESRKNLDFSVIGLINF